MDKSKSKSELFEVRHVTIAIAKDVKSVYEYASDPGNMPEWAPGFLKSIKKNGDHWIAQTPVGEAKVVFAPKNSFGIIDHDVTLGNGEHVKNQVRIIENNNGSQVIFSLFHLPGRTQKEYEEDFSFVQNDLKRLKEIMEKK